MTTTSAIGASTASTGTDQKFGFAALGQGDFLKLLTVQLQQQDPTDPVDNKEMLVQLAQFSSLSATTEMGDTLKSISSKLDVVLAAAAQNGAQASGAPQS